MEKDPTLQLEIERLQQHIKTLEQQNQIYRERLSLLKDTELQTAKLSAIVEYSDDAIISKNLDSIITSWNKSAERLFGYKAEEMIGRSILKIIPTERQHEEVIILEKLRSGKHVDHFETIRMRKDGSLIHVSLTISPLKDVEGNIIGLSKIARDITDRKQNEANKHDFVSMISHELKTPLTSLKTYMQVMQKKIEKQPEINEFIPVGLDKANRLVDKMVKLIHDFLDVSKIEAGKLSLNRIEFDLNELINEIIDDHVFLNTTHTITCQFHTEKLTVFADKEKITQVIINLLTNAIKYSPAGGNIIIATQKLNNKAFFSITDEGLGIDPIDQHQLFQRFFRCRRSKEKQISGFGIGLYLVSEILALHGSTIQVKSVVNKGSTFSFKLDCYAKSPGLHGLTKQSLF
ncbi:sensor histidine kinase [Pedobacter montanisoli]|uniref:histidine kinase n=1 Tax=Pedobacter montanisoli TaxID=2923277 RepID=A0ABS9ZVV7_9SPHI|nr:PAS domain S-box protein [Pedobacter montanisoli]MCJ0742433.1 PAS domain S-box protein [Pedobacter montanisoli]